MATMLVAKQFSCDICRARAIVEDPDVGKLPDGWAAMPVELYMNGVRVSDFCGACLRKPFAQILTDLMTIWSERKAVSDGDGD
jgi:hypothetical protein